MYVNHVLRIREQSFYRDSLAWVELEANYGGWQNADRIADLFQPKPKNVEALLRQRNLTNGRSLGSFYFMQKDPLGGSDRGVWTSDQQKDGGAELLREALSNGHVRIASSFVSSDEKGFLTKLKNQMANFREEIKESQDPIFGKFKRKLTGKSGGRQDDIMVTISLMMFWYRVVRTLPEFKNFCRGAGIPL